MVTDVFACPVATLLVAFPAVTAGSAFVVIHYLPGGPPVAASSPRVGR